MAKITIEFQVIGNRWIYDMPKDVPMNIRKHSEIWEKAAQEENLGYRDFKTTLGHNEIVIRVGEQAPFDFDKKIESVIQRTLSEIMQKQPSDITFKCIRTMS